MYKSHVVAEDDSNILPSLSLDRRVLILLSPARNILPLGGPLNNTRPSAISDEAMQKLVAHNWPGNVRELKNAIERAALLAGGDTIRLEQLPPEVSSIVPGRYIDKKTVRNPV